MEDRPVRSMLACGSRFARRVLPLVDVGRQASCAVNISFAECVAAGEPVGFMGSPNAVDTSRTIGKPEPTGSRSAQSAAEFVGAAALTVSALIDATPGSEFVVVGRPYTIKLLWAAFDRAREATLGHDPNDSKRATKGFDTDIETLRRHRIMDGDWLGEPIDAGEDGPFGKLWPEDAPSWYSKLNAEVMVTREPTIVAGEDIKREPELIERADIVCWHWDQKSGFALDEISSFIQNQVQQSNKNNQVPRVFVVHAPGLAEQDAAKLVLAGATFLSDPKIDDMVPETSGELARALALLMHKGYLGWTSEEGRWRYTARGGYLGWGLPYPEAKFGPDREESPYSKRGAYQSVIQDSKSLEERLQSESGWPIDI